MISSAPPYFVNSNNVVNSFNVLHNHNTDERPLILEWLSPLEPQKRHQEVRVRRFDGIGEWLLQTNKFIEWHRENNASSNPALFCSGDPGVGKTYISSLVIDTLCDEVGGENIAVGCFYCDFLSAKEHSTASLLGSLLRQLVGALGTVPGEIRETFEKEKGNIGGRGLSLASLRKMLQKTLTSFKRVFICIDALDELLAERRPEILRSLRHIIENSPNARLFLTGRPHVWHEIQKYIPKGVDHAVIKPNRNDIRAYLEMMLDQDNNPDAMDDDLRGEILERVPEAVSEIFLLVSLNVDAILGETTISRRRQKLKRMTGVQGLEDAYNATLQRIKMLPGGRPRLGMAVLMWVSHAERPLQADELRHAMGVEIGSSNLDSENVPSLQTLLGCCLGLVTVNEGSIVRLIHFTLQEYLMSRSNLFDKAHSTIAEVCLTYLNSQCIRDLSPHLSFAPSITPFLHYASCCWGIHARKDTTKDVISLAISLLHQFEDHISSKLLLVNELRTNLRWDYPALGFSGFHAAAFFGVADVAIALKVIGIQDVNGSDLTGSTPLFWAARNMHVELVKLLLGWMDVDPNRVDGKEGRTPLSWTAAYPGEEVDEIVEVTKLLLERKDVDPNWIDVHRRTPISLAAENGHARIVQLLLEREDINMGSLDGFGRTPLAQAARGGHEEVVKLILGHPDSAPNHPDNFGLTPLALAASNGCESVVKLLLERADINPNTTEKRYGQTPLSMAAESGRDNVVNILLKRARVDLGMTDKLGRTPLPWAAQNGHEGVVKILLEQTNLPPDGTDILNRTPLSLAAEYGYEGIVKLLLDRGCPNLSSPDKPNGLTPLLYAAQGGHQEIVKLLLTHRDIDLNQCDTGYGRTPLQWAILNRHHEVVQLLEPRNLNLHPKWAENNGHAAIPNTVNRRHKNPKKRAQEWRHLDTETSDEEARAPSPLATEGTKQKALKLSSEQKKASPTPKKRIPPSTSPMGGPRTY